VRQLPHLRDGVHIIPFQIPVIYESVLSEIPLLHLQKKPTLVIHVGVGKSGGFVIESKAHNKHYIKPDIQ
jgi:hypothetical protein